MEAKALSVVTPRTFRTGETPHLNVSTRNLEKLTFSVYKLNAESYFRKKHELDGGDDPDLIDGQSGNDRICGGLGADSLNGSDGNDTFSGAGGSRTSAS